MKDKPVIRGLNEITSRLGALCSIPLTMLDVVITGIAYFIFTGIYQIKMTEDYHTNSICLSNRMCSNIGVLALAVLRILFGARLPHVEKKMDECVASFIQTGIK